MRPATNPYQCRMLFGDVRPEMVVERYFGTCQPLRAKNKNKKKKRSRKGPTAELRAKPSLINTIGVFENNK